MKKSNAPSRLSKKQPQQQVLRKDETSINIAQLLEESQDAASDIILYHTTCKGKWYHESGNRLHKVNQVVYGFNICFACFVAFKSITQTRYICKMCQQCFCIECASDFYSNVQNELTSSVLGTDLLNQNSVLSSVKATSTTVCIGISYIDFLAYFY